MLKSNENYDYFGGQRIAIFSEWRRVTNCYFAWRLSGRFSFEEEFADVHVSPRSTAMSSTNRMQKQTKPF